MKTLHHTLRSAGRYVVAGPLIRLRLSKINFSYMMKARFVAPGQPALSSYSLFGYDSEARTRINQLWLRIRNIEAFSHERDLDALVHEFVQYNLVIDAASAFKSCDACIGSNNWKLLERVYGALRPSLLHDTWMLIVRATHLYRASSYDEANAALLRALDVELTKQAARPDIMRARLAQSM